MPLCAHPCLYHHTNAATASVVFRYVWIVLTKLSTVVTVGGFWFYSDAKEDLPCVVCRVDGVAL